MGQCVWGVTPQRRQCRRAIRCAFPLRQLTEPLDSRLPFSIHPYIRWVPSLGIVALHPPVTLHISPLGHGAGVQRHPRRCVYSSGAVPPRPDPIAMCSLKGSERARLRARAMHHSTNRSLLVERHQCISTLSDSKVSNYPGYRPRRWRLTLINMRSHWELGGPTPVAGLKGRGFPSRGTS